MAEEVRHRKNILNCELLRKTKKELLDINYKLKCLDLQKKNVDEKEICVVELNSLCSESSFVELIDANIQILLQLKDSIPAHGRKHPSQSGRKETDSGYCQSGELDRLSGIAERPDYSLATDNPSLISIGRRDDLHESHKNISNC